MMILSKLQEPTFNAYGYFHFYTPDELICHSLIAYLRVFPFCFKKKTPGPKVIQIFMLNSAEHEILNALKYKKNQVIQLFQARKA